MTDAANPFEDIEAAASAAIEKQLAIAKDLDTMPRDVTSFEADFLDSILVQLRTIRRPLSQKQIDVLRNMCQNYDVEFDL